MGFGIPGEKWSDLFPDIDSFDMLGDMLKRRRINLGLSLRKAGALVGKSGTWVRNIEIGKPGRRCWPSDFFSYLRVIGFSAEEGLLCMERFGLFPKTKATAMHFYMAIRRDG